MKYPLEMFSAGGMEKEQVRAVFSCEHEPVLIRF
jgi:hypothetical protein